MRAPKRVRSVRELSNPALVLFVSRDQHIEFLALSHLLLRECEDPFRFLHGARLRGNLLTLGQIRHPTIKKNDYYPLIARAVERLDRSTAEARRAVYERARKAVAELRSNQPALLDAEITGAILALEDAIRKVEAEAARKSPTETRTEPQSAPSEGMPDGDTIQSRDHGKPASPDRDDRPPALPSRQAPIFLPIASDDRHNTDIQAVAIGEAYGANHYHDDIPSSRWRGSLLVVMAVLALAALAGTFAYSAMFGGFPALPPIIKAGTGPNNIVRNNSDIRQSNSSQTPIMSAGSSEKLRPMDIREAPKAVPRVISTIPISSKPSAAPVGPLAPAPAVTAPALDPPVAASVPPPASTPLPVLASSEPKETVAVAPVAREPGAPSPALAPPLLTAASVPPPASAPLPVPASSEPSETAAVASVAREPGAPSPALAPPLLTTASVPPPASAPLPVPASSEPKETAAVAPVAREPGAPSPALAPPLPTAASVPPPASAPLPVPASSEPKETAAVAPVAREPGAPSPALAPPLLTTASVPPPASRLEWIAKSDLPPTKRIEPGVLNAPAVQPMNPENAVLMEKGQVLMRSGDIASARLLFQRLANAGIADAALALQRIASRDELCRSGRLLLRELVIESGLSATFTAGQGLRFRIAGTSISSRADLHQPTELLPPPVCEPAIDRIKRPPTPKVRNQASTLTKISVDIWRL